MRYPEAWGLPTQSLICPNHRKVQRLLWGSLIYNRHGWTCDKRPVTKGGPHSEPVDKKVLTIPFCSEDLGHIVEATVSVGGERNAHNHRMSKFRKLAVHPIILSPPPNPLRARP